MLTIEDVRSKLALSREMLVESYNVESLHVFGSVARGETPPSSDVDVLVDFTGPADFMTFMNLKELLEDLLSAKVDLVTRKALKPALKLLIEDEAVRVA